MTDPTQTDRLAEIKEMFIEDYGAFDNSMLTARGLGIRNNYAWLIAEVERLRDQIREANTEDAIGGKDAAE